MSKRYNRREMLSLTGRAAIAGAIGSRLAFGVDEKTVAAGGVVVGNAIAAGVGQKILAVAATRSMPSSPRRWRPV